MRPARKGPENAEDLDHPHRPDRSFNEAGPQGAGKQPTRPAPGPAGGVLQ